MSKFHVKKTSLGENDKSLILKGKITEGAIDKGMTIEIPITAAATISMKIHDVVHFDHQHDDDKRDGLVLDFTDDPDALDIALDLNIADEDLNVK